jgi:hypothetical protein
MSRMKRQKRVLLAILLILIVLQFIQPARNKNGQVLPTDFTKIYAVPGEVQTILQGACYDCHSNNTLFPWYVHTQPMAWIMAGHIKNGKEKLNFSEFGSYPVRRRISKLKAIANSIEDDVMPLSSYKWMHKSANLSEADKTLPMDWMRKKADSLTY